LKEGHRLKTRIDRFKVKQRMEALGIDTFEELAKRAKLSPATLYNALDGYNWRSTTLDAIANALGCSSREITTIDVPEVSPATSAATR
jgi:lambda repressor-like predicted transcriptional regulator